MSSSKVDTDLPASGPGHGAAEDASTVELIREVIEEARGLVRLEIEIAKNEAQVELQRAKRAAIGLGVAVASALLVVCLLAMALVLALGGTAVTALLVAAGFLVVGGAAGYVGYTMLPTKPLRRTRRRIEGDVRRLKEHVA